MLSTHIGVLLLVLFPFTFAAISSTWTKKDQYFSKRLISAIKQEYSPPIRSETYQTPPELPSSRLMKRDASEISIHPWSYPLIHWGFVSKDLNFALTVEHKLLVSRDSLMTFSERTDVNSSDMCYEVEVNELNRNIIFLLGIHASWVSVNSGTTFIRKTSTSSKFYLIFHPTQENWALSINQFGDLFITKNLGDSWTLVVNQVSQYDWCQAGTNGLTEERLCIISNQDKHFKISDDLGKTWFTPLPETAQFFRIHDRFFTLIAEYEDQMDLYVSSDRGRSFHRALLPEKIPVGALQEYQFIEDDYGVIWIVVGPPASPGVSSRGNLYVSDAEGYKFTKVLPYVHTINNKGYTLWDVELVRSIEGTFIANILLSENPVLIKTQITWNNGDNWFYLSPPQVDSNGTAIICPHCTLNLFGITTWLGAGGGLFGPVYTDAHAVGMIIGTGSVGSFLPIGEANKINTYFSRDGGLNWDELMKGSTIYEYGDFGGLIVLASNVAPTNTIYYSLNGGLNFSTVLLPEVVDILNIVVASTQNERFIVIANVPGFTEARKYWGIDFSRVLERNCTSDDYETWEPHDGVRGPKCVLGHDIVYRRRKREASCYTEDGLNKIVSSQNCLCDENDYECDYYFERTLSGACASPYPDLASENQKNQCVGGATFYNLSSGYRKVPGDTCINEITAFRPTLKICPNGTTAHMITSHSIAAGTVILIVVLLLIFILLAGCIGFLIGLRDENFRKKFPWVKAPAWVHIGYSNQLVEETDGDEEFVGNRETTDPVENSDKEVEKIDLEKF